MKRLFSAICAVFLLFGALISGVFTTSCSGLSGLFGSAGLAVSGGSSGATAVGSGTLAGERLINSVVLVNFSGEKSFDDERKAIVKSVFSEGENSLGSYVSFISLGKTSVVTEIVGEVTIGFSADYFMPAYAYSTDEAKYVKVNENGYDNRRFTADGKPDANGPKKSADEFLRSEELVAAANEKITCKTETDGNGDGAVDCFALVFALDETPAEDSLLWAKKSVYLTGNADDLKTAYVVDEKYSGKEIKPQKLGDKSINDYIFLPYPMLEKKGKLNSVAACHEFMHVLGAADAYSYETTDEEFVGELDIMASGYGDETPRMPLAYTLYKIGFLNEGENIAPVLASGEYTLFSTESGQGKTKAYKLVLPEYKTKRESFYVEYREKTGYGAGLSSGFEDGAFIVYRVNERNGYARAGGVIGKEYLGNAYGEPETFAFRFRQKLLFGGYRENPRVSANGISHAAISDLVGYTSFGENKSASGAITYSDGTETGVIVSFKRRNSDGSATFEINFDCNAEVLAEVDYRGIIKDETGIFARFYAPLDGRNIYVLEADKPLSSHTPEDIVNGKFGEPTVTPAAFMRARLSGEKNYVYVVYEENGKFIEKPHVLTPSGNNSVLKSVLVSAVALLAGVVVVTAAIVICITAKKHKNASKK